MRLITANRLVCVQRYKNDIILPRRKSAPMPIYYIACGRTKVYETTIIAANVLKLLTGTRYRPLHVRCTYMICINNIL